MTFIAFFKALLFFPFKIFANASSKQLTLIFSCVSLFSCKIVNISFGKVSAK